MGGGAYQGEVEIPGDPVDGGRPKDCMLKVVSATDKENYQRVLYDGMIRLALESDGGLVEYLSRVIAEPDIAVFLSVRDDAANALSDGMQDMLHALGLKETLQGNFRSDYIAVIDKGEVIAETLSPESIEETGMLSDGTTWRLESSRDANDQNTVSSILIGGEEYSLNRQGINFAVYSYESGQVVQRCCYNTFRNWPYAAVTVDDSRYAQDGTIEIVVEDLDSYSNAVSGWIWNEIEPDWKKTLAPTNDEETPYWRTTVDAKSLVREPGDVLRISFYGSGDLYNTMYICGTSWQPPQ